MPKGRNLCPGNGYQLHNLVRRRGLSSEQMPATMSQATDWTPFPAGRQRANPLLPRRNGNYGLCWWLQSQAARAMRTQAKLCAEQMPEFEPSDGPSSAASCHGNTDQSLEPPTHAHTLFQFCGRSVPPAPPEGQELPAWVEAGCSAATAEDCPFPQRLTAASLKPARQGGSRR